MADVNQLTFAMQVFGTLSTGTIIYGALQETSDPSFIDANWFQVGQISVTGVGLSKQTYSGLRRFVRGKVTIPSAASAIAATLALNGICREP